MKISKSVTVHEEVEINLPVYSKKKGLGWDEYFFIREDAEDGSRGINFILFDSGKWNLSNYITSNRVNDALDATPITEDEFMVAWKELLVKVLSATNIVSPLPAVYPSSETVMILDGLPSAIDTEPTEVPYKTGYAFAGGERSPEWDLYYADLKEHEEIYEQKKPQRKGFVLESQYKRALSDWDFAKHMDEPNKPGYVIANND